MPRVCASHLLSKCQITTRQFVHLGLVAVFALSVASACGSSQSTTQPDTSDAQAMSLDAAAAALPAPLADLAGEPVLVWFWAPT